jgi:hypothetical protein
MTVSGMDDPEDGIASHSGVSDGFINHDRDGHATVCPLEIVLNHVLFESNTE